MRMRLVLAKCAEEAAKWTGDVPKQYGDYREMLEKEKPDVAIVATPDHWHALATIAAVRAGIAAREPSSTRPSPAPSRTIAEGASRALIKSRSRA